MKTKIKISALIISSLLCTTSSARSIPDWPYEKLVEKSDVVAIIQPVENKPAKDSFQGYSYGHPLDHFEATDTLFEVHTVLKGDKIKNLTVLNFSYSNKISFIANGACFIRFRTGVLQYKKTVIKDEKPTGEVTIFAQKPEWLAFLKRRSDGRFEPVTGFYDSTFSFRELHTASFYAER